jgi:non-heme chloroperoxidase
VRRFKKRAASILLLSLASTIHAQKPLWKDTSPHTTQFVTVEKGVRLEVLDWGGSGRPLVLLAGGGDTAHIFDDFAPKLTASFHVYGITRRGFGQSGFSPEGYGADRLGNDVITVVDALELKRPVLVGHSLGGEELSSVATRHPNRVAGLVYLEAGYPYAFDNGKGPSMQEFLEARKLMPPPPPPSESDLASFNALQQYCLRGLGFTYPAGELRQQFSTTPEGRVGKQRDFPGNAVMLRDMQKFTDIRVSALVIFALPHAQGKWTIESTGAVYRFATCERQVAARDTWRAESGYGEKVW